MSMTYYAVTNDPNELAHFGILGMKWGVRHDKPRHSGSGSKSRSAAYKKASAKLSNTMRNGIAKAETKWKAYNSPKAKEARFMKKAMQQARNGTLKYGKLTDNQVRRVTERLALERNARQLGSTENPRFSKRLKIAVGEGIIRGIGQGTGAYIEERFRGRGRTTAELKADKRKAKYEAKGSTIRRKVNKDIDTKYYEDMAESTGRAEGKIRTGLRIGANTAATGLKLGMTVATGGDEKEIKDVVKEGLRINRANAQTLTGRGRGRVVAQRRIADKEEERRKRQEEARDRSYYTNLGKLQAEKEMKGLEPPKSSEPSKPTAPTAVVTRTGSIRSPHKPTRDRDNRPTVRPVSWSKPTTERRPSVPRGSINSGPWGVYDAYERDRRRPRRPKRP